MKIYRFVPDLERFAHPRRSIVGRWWPDGIELGSWMDCEHGDSSLWGRPHADGYDPSPPELPFSDFPVLSLQVPVVSERAAERLGFHPDRSTEGPSLVGRLRPMSIGGQRFFAVQPLLEVRGEAHAFIPEASVGIPLPRGEIVHYHTRMFEPSRLRGEFFTIPAHEPYAETYVTGAFVDRAREAGLTGIDHLELVFDDGPIPPRHTPPPPEMLDNPTYRQDLEWELFRDRGYMDSYLRPELEACFRHAVLDGLLPITTARGA
ncbi:MAG TPA: hypothetical protein VN253_19865 [Kofleriaceae bacterium]|nr:hypothetical protein [Kofleriaceae bacterium]